ncbi:histidine kinase [Caballeronia sordidicola]|uniref:histidine kinase n=1 Tax=Caballeronia sordidicola TaxID=196367 RepID=A0A158G2A1_CABSO|nr:GAF domain-containing sensor histidine kinase [Caballeronia sordidicola]SAL26053.1 histidine kinase [Caballeronia sordidicola]
MTNPIRDPDAPESIAHDVALIGAVTAIPSMLRVICKNAGMGFSAVARVTDLTWTACAVNDEIGFGLQAGSQLELRTTLCHESRNRREPIVIDSFSEDAHYAGHPTSQIYGLESYISVPIVLSTGEYFGNLCAIDSKPAHPSDERVVKMMEAFAEVIALQIENENREQMAQRLAERREQDAHLREQFIAVLGHDLRSPLAVVSATGELLALRKADVDLAKFGARLLGASRRMSALINDVLDFARGRLGAGIEADIKPDSVLETELREVVSEVQTANPDCMIIADLSVESVVYCDNTRLQQLLSNLLSNAVFHGSTDHPVTVKARIENETLELSVHNLGNTIAAESLGNLFEPYWRPKTSKPGGGLGLGLFICSEIVNSHHGTLTVSSSDQSGTLFTAKMPVSQKAA